MCGVTKYEINQGVRVHSIIYVTITLARIVCAFSTLVRDPYHLENDI
jgi:hypothetical protein